MTKGRRRPHPAAASRVLAAGVSAASVAGLVAAFNLAAPVPTATAGPAVAQPVRATAAPPRRVIVIIHRVQAGAATPAPLPAAASSDRPAAPAAVPAPAPRPAPVTTTRSS